MSRNINRIISLVLLISFFTTQLNMSFAYNNLAVPVLSDREIIPGAGADKQFKVASDLEPGAIGNGIPLLNLIAGDIPARITENSEDEYSETYKKIDEAVKIAIEKHSKNKERIPAFFRPRSGDIARNLVALKDKRDLIYLYNAVVKGDEHYLLGFNNHQGTLMVKRGTVGLALELVNRLYEASPELLAQYIYHECVPEFGPAMDRNDHRNIYQKVQSAVFGDEEVTKLGKQLRDFITELNIGTNPMGDQSLEYLVRNAADNRGAVIDYENIRAKIFDGRMKPNGVVDLLYSVYGEEYAPAPVSEVLVNPDAYLINGTFLSKDKLIKRFTENAFKSYIEPKIEDENVLKVKRLAEKIMDAFIKDERFVGLMQKKKVQAAILDIWRILLGGHYDPYRELKKTINSLSLEKFPDMWELVDNSDTPLLQALSIAVKGNLIDMKDLANAGDMFADILALMGKTDDLVYEEEDLKDASAILNGRMSSILYITDNSGEIVADMALIRYLVNKGHLVTIAVRELPTVNDISITDLEDVERIIDECIPGARMKGYVSVISSGSRSMGTDLRFAKQAFRKAWTDSALVISKGEGNWESLRYNMLTKPVLFLVESKTPEYITEVKLPASTPFMRFLPANTIPPIDKLNRKALEERKAVNILSALDAVEEEIAKRALRETVFTYDPETDYDPTKNDQDEEVIYTLDELFSVILPLVEDADHKRGIVEIQMKGPQENSASLVEALDKTPDKFKLDDSGIEELKSIVPELAIDGTGSFKIVNEVIGKHNINVNRQQILAALLYWINNEDKQKETAGAVRVEGIDFTRADADDYIATAEEYVKQEDFDKGLLFFSYCLNVLTGLGEDHSAVIKRMTELLELVASRTHEKVKERYTLEDVRRIVYLKKSEILIKSGGLGGGMYFAVQGRDTLQGDKSEFQTLIDEAMRINQGNEYNYHIQMLIGNLNVGNTKPAIYHGRICVRLKPKDPGAYINLGAVYDHADDYAMAIKMLGYAIRLAPDDPASYSNIGIAYKKTNQYKKAEGVYKKGARLMIEMQKKNPDIIHNATYNSDFHNLLSNFGSLYYEMGRYKEAVICLEESLKYKAGDREVLSLLANINSKISSKSGANRSKALKGLKFIYSFLSSEKDAEGVIKDLRPIINKAKEEGKKVRIVFPMSFVSISDLRQLLPDDVKSEIVYKRIEDNTTLANLILRVRPVLEHYQNVLRSGDKDVINEMLSHESAYNRRLLSYLAEENAEILIDEQPASLVRARLKAQWCSRRVNEILSLEAGKLEPAIPALLEYKRHVALNLVQAISMESRVSFERATQIKYQYPDDEVVVICGIFAGGTEKILAGQDFDTEAYYPSTSGFANFLVPEYRLVNERVLSGNIGALFTEEDNKTLLKSFIGDFIFTILNVENTFQAHIVAKSIVDRISDDDMVLLVKQTQMDREDAEMNMAIYILKWLILHAKITTRELRLFKADISLDYVDSYCELDVIYLIDQLSHPDLAVAKQSALVLANLVKKTAKEEFRKDVFFRLVVKLLAEDGEKLTKGMRVKMSGEEVVERFLKNPKTQLQYLVRLISANIVMADLPEDDETVLENDVRALAKALVIDDEKYEAEARRRLYAENKLQDLVYGYFDEDTKEQDRGIFKKAIVKLKEKHITDLITQELFGDHARRILLAAEILGEIGDERAVLPLIYQLRHENEEVKDAAERAILKIGPEGLATIEKELDASAGKITGEVKDKLAEIAKKLKTPALQKKSSSRQGSGDIKPLTADDITADLNYRAELFKTYLINQLKAQNDPSKVYMVALDTDIGGAIDGREGQHTQINPTIYKAVMDISEMRDTQGERLFPNLIAVKQNGSALVGKIKQEAALEAMKGRDVVKVFMVGRHKNFESGLFDALGELDRKTTICTIKDTEAGNYNYIPVFEAATLAIMSALNVDMESIKSFYDRVSGSEISIDELRAMVADGVLYLLPKATSIDPETLRSLYERVVQIYTAA